MTPVPDNQPYKLTRKLANSLNDGTCPVIEESKRAADEMSSDDDHLELLEVTNKKVGSKEKNQTPTSLLAIAGQENSIVFESSATIDAAVLTPESPPKNRRPSTVKEMSLAELFDEDKVHSTCPRTGSSGSIECGDGGSSAKRRPSTKASESTEPSTLPTVEIDIVNSKTLSVIESVDDHDVPNEREEKKKSGWYLSHTMLCGICTCYTITLVLILVLGIGFGYILLPSYIDEGTTSPSNNVDNGDISEPTRNSTSSTNLDGDILTAALSSSTIPSYAPSSTVSDTPSYFPSHLSSETPSSSKIPSRQPSWQPTGSLQPTISSSPTLTPSLPLSSSPSDIPSASPTMRLECPEQLTMVVTLDEEGLFTMKYHVVIYPDDYGDGLGGILCASLEYSGYASWLGLALSDATRDPRFGRKEAIIGIPGIQQTMAVVSSDVGSASLGQQVGGGIKDGPPFQNPAKYIIPAGGIGDGYSGPSLILLSDKQTLMNGSVIVDPNNTTNITQMTFEKYLTETNEIRINPYEPNLFMYAAASEVNEDEEFDVDSPEWKYVSLTLLVKEEDDTLDVNDTLTYELVDDLVDDIYSLYVTEDEDDDSTTSTSDIDTEIVETASVETANVEVSNLRKRTRLHETISS